MAEKKPANHTPARVERHDDLGPDGVERTPHQRALLRIVGLAKVVSANEMRVPFEPADQRIALAIFDLGGFRKATHARPKAISFSLPNLGENAHATDAGGVSHAFDHIGEQSLDVVK